MRGLSDTFVHEALLYRDLEDFLAGTTRFLQEGLAWGTPALVAVPEPRLSALRAALGPDADDTLFVDMGVLGRNPSRILPAIAEFIGEHPGEPVRFIGEPSWPGRRECEAIEAARHEALINVAFGRTSAAILCPYDVSKLGEARLADAECTHPFLVCGSERRPSTSYSYPLDVWAAADRPFDEPGTPLASFAVVDGAPGARKILRAHLEEAAVGEEQATELLLCASEVITNAVMYAEPPIRVRLWLDGRDVVCDVIDSGLFDDPLAGRQRPAADALSGRGLWIVNQFCDLTEIRPGPDGTTVRMRMRRTG